MDPAEKWPLLKKHLEKFLSSVSPSRDDQLAILPDLQVSRSQLLTASLLSALRALISTLQDFEEAVKSSSGSSNKTESGLEHQDVHMVTVDDVTMETAPSGKELVCGEQGECERKGDNSVCRDGVIKAPTCSGDCGPMWPSNVNQDTCTESDRVELEVPKDEPNAKEVAALCMDTGGNFPATVELSEKRNSEPDSNLVQIKAPKSEIERRISALIEQKQVELDKNNQREFCSIFPEVSDFSDSCARTDAVFVPRAGSRSHLKVSRVVNMYGPQTQHILSSTAGLGTSTKVKEEQDADGLEERVANIESHMKVKVGASKSDMYSRIKSLEERILFLESLSPEYFSHGPPKMKRQRRDSGDRVAETNRDELSIPDIDARIRGLKEALTKKTAAG